MAEYKCSSAVQIGTKLYPAGKTITDEELSVLPEDRRKALLDQEHIIETAASGLAAGSEVSPFPGKRSTKKPEA